MIETIQSLVESENTIKFITAGFLFYAIILWLLVPIWVYIDSKKKYNNPTLSLFLFAIILPLNIPGILFYIIIRPEDELGFSEQSDKPNHSNLNIPVVNFVNGKDDIVMSLELKINGNIINDKFKQDLNLDINLNSNTEDIEITHADEVVQDEVEEISVDEQIPEESAIAKISASIAGIFASLKPKRVKTEDSEEDTNEDTNEDTDEDTNYEVGVNLSEEESNDDSSNNSKKSNKKKNKKNKKKSKR